MVLFVYTAHIHKLDVLGKALNIRLIIEKLNNCNI